MFLVSTVACTHMGRESSKPTVPEPSAYGKVEYSDAYYHYSLGVKADLRGNLDNSIKEYEKALSLDPGSSYLMTQLATLYMRKNNITSALQLLKQSLIHDPDYADTHLLLGAVYSRLKEYDNALESYKKVIKLDSNNLESYLFLGLLYRETSEYEKAVGALNSLLNIDPDNLMGNYYIAKIYMDMASYDKAEKSFKKSLAINPSFESAITDLAMLYEVQRKEEDALEFFSDFVRRNPSAATARLHLGKIMLRQEKYKDAAREFSKILDENASHMEARYSLGLAYFFEGKDYNKAIEEFLLVLSKFPDDNRTRYFLASSYDKNGQHMKAFNEFKTVSQDSKLYPSALTHMALILKDAGRSKEAIELIRGAVAGKEGEADLYGLLASLYDADNQIDLAENTLIEAIKVFPDDIDLRYKLAVIYEKTDRFSESVIEMKKLLKIDKNNAEALNFIGYGYADRGIKLDEAERLIKKALELKPDNGFITDSLGWLYFKTGRIDLAIKYLEKASEMLPDDPTIAEHLGDAYRKAGMDTAAKKMYLKALDLKQLSKETLQEKINQLSGD